MMRLAVVGLAAAGAVTLGGCGAASNPGAESSASPKDPNLASASPATATDGSLASEACMLVPASTLHEALGLDVGRGAASLKTTDLSVCSYKPSPTSFVLVQSTHRADVFFPAAMYPGKGQQTVPVPAADRGYATVVTGRGLLNVQQLLVVSGDRGVQVSVAAKGSYTTDDLVALGRKILAEL